MKQDLNTLFSLAIRSLEAVHEIHDVAPIVVLCRSFIYGIWITTYAADAEIIGSCCSLQEVEWIEIRVFCGQRGKILS